jgi:hypothetical protein
MRSIPRKDSLRAGRTVATLAILEDLASIWQAMHGDNALSYASLRSPIGETTARLCASGLSLTEALSVICGTTEFAFGRMVFGQQVPEYDARAETINATGSAGILRLSVTPPLTAARRPVASRDTTVTLATDFRTFVIEREGAGQQQVPIGVFTPQELCQQIDLSGSVWDFIYPEHFAIVSRTVSYTIPHDTAGALFGGARKPGEPRLQVEQKARDRLACFEGPGMRLVSLEGLCVNEGPGSTHPKLTETYHEGHYTLRRYHPGRSAIFDYGEPAGDLTRPDFVTTYNAGGKEFHRDFVIMSDQGSKRDEELQQPTFDILHMLAIRRAKLFRTGLAERVYNILLPPIVLSDQTIRSDGYVLFACLNLYRTEGGAFRRTVSLTFLVCPVARSGEEGYWGARRAPLKELYELRDDLFTYHFRNDGRRRYATGGPLLPYIGLDDSATIPELIYAVGGTIVDRVVAGGDISGSAQQNEVADALFTANQESRIATLAIQVEWSSPQGFAQPWEAWLAGREDATFCTALYRTLFYADFLDPASGDASRHAVDLRQFNVGNTLGADMAGMSLYNPQTATKLVLYPRSSERYPNHSIVRWVAWHVYIDSALTALRALLYKFYPIVEARGDLHSIIGALDEMVQEFIDFYDLDIRDFFYRCEYEKLRGLMRLDVDYAQLLGKFSSSKEDESLREQRLVNKLLISLTLATVTATIVSTVSASDRWTTVSYVAAAVASSAIVVLLGYALFDPVRLAVDTLYARLFDMKSKRR